MEKIKRFIIYIIVSIIYLFGTIWYEKKYLTGKHFNRYRFSAGWRWILVYWFGQKVMGKNRHVPWPVPPHINIANPQNIIFDPDNMQNFMVAGGYYQGIGAKIYIGTNTYIAPGCGLITSNHSLEDLSKSAPGKDIIIGQDCWIGMNSVLLPGVELGDHTVVGAGSIVTKSFPQGNCVIAGNPAKIIRTL